MKRKVYGIGLVVVTLGGLAVYLSKGSEVPVDSPSVQENPGVLANPLLQESRTPRERPMPLPTAEVKAPKPNLIESDKLKFGDKDASKNLDDDQRLAKKEEAKALFQAKVEQHLRSHSLIQAIDLNNSQLACASDFCEIKVVVDPESQLAKSQLLTELSFLWSGIMRDYKAVIKKGSVDPLGDGIELKIEFYSNIE